MNYWQDATRLSWLEEGRNMFLIEIFSLNFFIFLSKISSTFGFVAAIRSGRYPLFFQGRMNSTKCERFTPSNPSLRPDTQSSVF